MWWRALGVAVVLLCVGVAGGYAVADRSQQEPVGSDTLEPVPAQSPAVPTPPEQTYLPDPETEPLAPDLPSKPVDLRVSRRGLGVTVDIPEGWHQNQVAETNMWNFVKPGNPFYTYLLRVNVVRLQNVSISVVKDSRITALEESDSDADGAVKDFIVTAQSDDTFEATYTSGGYQRFTMEKFVSFDDSHAYASVAVTGRAVDKEGLRDLLNRTVDSMQPLDARAPKQPDQP
jgi:hypothetical protein